MGSFWLFPPVAFIIFLVLSMALMRFTRVVSAKGKDSAGKEKAYACGQDTIINKVQPNYQEFFPFVFFFTIMHAAVLLIATMPANGIGTAIFFIAVILVSLRILLRR